MIEERELVTLLTGTLVLSFLMVRRKELRQIPNSAILLFSFGILVAGWLFTVLEGFVMPVLLNLLEHTCYSTSSVLLCIWAWKTYYRQPERT